MSPPQPNPPPSTVLGDTMTEKVLMLATLAGSSVLLALSFQPAPTALQRQRHNFGRLRASARGESDDDSLADTREGMADAFSALDSLSADDFDDYMPSASLDGFFGSAENLELSAKQFGDMKAELESKGDDGLYDEMFDSLGTSSAEDGGDGGVTLLAQLEEATVEPPVLENADGLGVSTSDSLLTTADVSNDILNQEVKPSMSMNDFISKSINEAVAEIDDMAPDAPDRPELNAKTAEQLLEDAELRKAIESIFDDAGERLRLEVEQMKKEQKAATQTAADEGLEYLESERQRLTEAEESVTRLIQKVAKETDAVAEAMAELEQAKNQVSEGGNANIENTALDLKKGGLIRQASLVGALLFGSRAFTETILVFNSPYGDEHFVSATCQAAITMLCIAYLVFAKNE